MLCFFHPMSRFPALVAAMLLAERLLTWYDQNRRVLPWRAGPGERADPYKVWLSEIMLQQTTVSTVTPYFRNFLSRWPTITDLARAHRDDVLTEWAGLGYYARAHNLHKCAQILVTTREATFPTDVKILRKLPGIGHYTAAAISAIAFGKRAIAVDSNVERLIIRLFAITEPPSIARSRMIHIMADMLTPNCRCGDFIQATMDLGAILCRPRNPSCIVCPLNVDCAGYQQGTAQSFQPVTRRERQTRHGIAFCAVCQEGAILLCRRPQKGLLGGMMGMPSTPWQTTPWQFEDAILAAVPVPFFSWSWQLLPGSVHHTFTHFQLDLRVAYGRGPPPRLPLPKNVYGFPRKR